MNAAARLSPTVPRAGRPPLRRRLRTAAAVLALVGAAGVALVFVRPDLAEHFANLLRTALGPTFVARLEDAVYGARDRVLLQTQGRGVPVSYWSPTTATPLTSAGPVPVLPPFPEVAAPGDGSWTPVGDDLVPDDPFLFKTQIHPDPARGRAVVAILAIRAADARLHLFAGTEEPDVAVPRQERPGVIPDAMHRDVVAIWSGGFRSINGRYGMQVANRTYHPPRRTACTLALHRDGRVLVDEWSALASQRPDFVALRQAPPCLVQHGELGAGVHRDDSHIWGVSVDGETIIRRSGFGVSRDGVWWFYAIGDELTTQALASTFKRVGAEGAMLLDVNVAPTRLLFYRREPTGLVGTSWLPGSKIVSGMYVTRPWERDFFALTRVRPG